MTSPVDVPVTHTLTHANTHTQFSTSSALHLGADTCSHGNTINGGATRVSKSFPPSASSSSSHRSWHLELSRCVPVHPSTIFFSLLYIFTFYRFLSLCLASDHAHAKRQRTHTYKVHSVALNKYEHIITCLGLYFSSMHSAVFLHFAQKHNLSALYHRNHHELELAFRNIINLFSYTTMNSVNVHQAMSNELRETFRGLFNWNSTYWNEFVD